MQLRRVFTLIFTVVFVFSLAVPASAVDAVYSVSPDTSVFSAPIYYTDGYYPGVVFEMRNAGIFANRIAHGSYSEMNYNPSWFFLKSSAITSGDFNSITPEVLADQYDVSAVYSIPNTSFTNGNSLTFNLPNTEDAYFDFQSSNFLFDQQSPQANTFYINGTLTFNLRNLWSFNGIDADLNTKNVSWYLASDPLAVQLVIDGKAYGDIIDVTGYTSPFTALYNGGFPSNASVSFDNLKVYYQGDTPDMIGFRVYTGSAFTAGQYNYGAFTAVGVNNTVTFRVSTLPDITFVQEGGDGYAGDLSSIQSSLSSLLTAINNGFNSIRTFFTTASGNAFLDALGNRSETTSDVSLSNLIRYGFLGLRSMFNTATNSAYLSALGERLTSTSDIPFSSLVRYGFLGLRSLMVSSSGTSFLSLLNEKAGSLVASLDAAQSYVSDTVFPWQSFNMQTHQLNASTNITGQNNLFLTAFQSMEDKLGRLAYVFGSDEDLALKDSADPGTDAFRENFGGGLSLGQIKDGADVVEGVSGLFDSGYDFGDAFSEISGDSMFTMWFSSQNAAALDSTSSVMALDDDDPYNMQIYYDRIHEVTAKRDREEGDTND